MTIDTLISFIIVFLVCEFIAFFFFTCIMICVDEKNKYKRGQEDDLCERCDSSDKKS